MTLYGYARVSVREPEDKNLDLQVERLVRAGCALGNVRAEEASGAKNDRGGLLELLNLLVVEGDTLVVTHIDRLSRGLTDYLRVLSSPTGITYFLVQLGAQGRVAIGLLLLPVAEHAGGSRAQGFFPGLNLAGMDLVPRRQLGHLLLPLHRLQGHLGFERRAVLSPSFGHFPLLPGSNRCLQFRSRTLA